jgi:hypothetical protein
VVAGGWFVLREKYGRLVADKPSEQARSEIRLVQRLFLQIFVPFFRLVVAISFLSFPFLIIIGVS